MTIADLLQSKTIWGTLLLILSYLTDPGVVAQLSFVPAWAHTLLVVVGGLLTAIGVRAAIQKSGPTS